MSFFTRMGLRRALRTMAVLLVATATAQSCFYPDGSISSSDTTCSTNGEDSACCGSADFCLSGGLCLSGGVVMRKTCTDKTWESAACSGYCKTENADASIAITPCTSSSFVCGMNNTNCQTNSNTFTLSGSTDLVLRASQVATLVQSSLESQAANSTATCTAAASTALYQYTSGQMAGLGCALGFPLALALLTALILLRREKAKHSGGKNLMYKLPDNHTEFSFQRPPPIPTQSPMSLGAYSARQMPHSRAGSTSTTGIATPVHMQSFGERYESMKKSKVTEIQVERHELDGTLPQYSVRHELGGGEGVKRM